MMRATNGLQAFLAALLCLVWLGRGAGAWSIVRGDSVSLLNTSRGVYAVRPNTECAGDVLVDGEKNLQPDVLACAESCDRTVNCTYWNWCGAQTGCVADPSGATHAYGACELEVLLTTDDGIGVMQLAADRGYLGAAGIKLAIEDPGPVSGYQNFLGRSLLRQYDIECPEDKQVAGRCSLQIGLQEAKAKCDGWAECKAFVFLPLGLENRTVGPLAQFKGSTNGSLVDLSLTNLTPRTALYVKDGRLALEPVVTSSGDGAGGSGDGLSIGATIGIAVGASCGVALALIGGVLWWWRRQQRRHRLALGLKSNGSGSSKGPKGLSGLSASTGGPPSGVLDSAMLAEQGELAPVTATAAAGTTTRSTTSPELHLFQEARAPSWGDVMIPPSAVTLCLDSEGHPIRLGGGAGGDVFQARVHGGTICAAKCFALGEESGEARARRFAAEAGMLWRLHSPCVVSFLGVSVTEGRGMLLMELMEGGDLGRAMNAQLHNGQGRLFGWYNRGRRIAQQIAAGLAFLHEKRIVHLDLKPRNVLLSRDRTAAKIADVGFSRIMHRDCLSELSYVGTFDWCAPEVLLGQPATTKADIYSFGIILWELATGEAPKRGSLRPLAVPVDCPAEVAELQRRCVQSDPARRPSAEEIMAVLQRSEPQESAPGQQQGSEQAQGSAGGGGSDAGAEQHQVLRSVMLPDNEVASPLVGALASRVDA